MPSSKTKSLLKHLRCASVTRLNTKQHTVDHSHGNNIFIKDKELLQVQKYFFLQKVQLRLSFMVLPKCIRTI